MPGGATIYRTDEVIRRLNQIALKTKGVKHTVALPGFSVITGTNQSNAGTMFCALDSFEERAGKADLSGGAITGRMMKDFSQVQEGLARVFPPPPVRGIGTAGGFRLQIEDLTGQATPQEMQSVVAQVMGEAAKDTKLTGLFSGYRANVPQLYAN